MTARPGPTLVSAGGPGPEQPAPPPPARRRPAPLPWAVLAVLVLAALAALLWGAQERRRADALAGRLEAQRVELEAARERVAAHERHLDAIRDGMAELAARVEALAALAAREPGDPAPAPDAPPADAH